MHELAICQALIDRLERVADEHGASGIRTVTVQIGALSGVVPSLLENAFRVARTGTCARAAELHTETLEPTIRCRRCELESITPSNRLVCPACGARDAELISGDEMLLRQVELDVPDRDSTGEQAHV